MRESVDVGVARGGVGGPGAAGARAGEGAGEAGRAWGMGPLPPGNGPAHLPPGGGGGGGVFRETVLVPGLGENPEP